MTEYSWWHLIKRSCSSLVDSGCRLLFKIQQFWSEAFTVKSQVKVGTVFGVELGLHYSWFVIALLITFSLAGEFHATNLAWSDTLVWSTAILTGVLFFACLFAHELSHALVARMRGLPIHKITLFLLGGVAQMEKGKRPILRQSSGWRLPGRSPVQCWV